MHRQAFLVVRPRLSSPNPNISKPISRTANSDFWNWLTHKLLGRLKSTIPNLQIYLPKKVNSEKLGLGVDNPCKIVFWVCRWTSACRGLMTGIFGILESSATQWYQDVIPSQELFFHRHIYSLWLKQRVIHAWTMDMKILLVHTFLFQSSTISFLFSASQFPFGWS